MLALKNTFHFKFDSLHAQSYEAHSCAPLSQYWRHLWKKAGKIKYKSFCCGCILFLFLSSKKMGKFSKACANERHEAWRSISPLMVNLKSKVGVKNVFFKAFKQKDAKRFCSHEGDIISTFPLILGGS